ncbi:unnamed protein product, partial [Nesidiocoris tenuis]
MNFFQQHQSPTVTPIDTGNVTNPGRQAGHAYPQPKRSSSGLCNPRMWSTIGRKKN